MRPHNGLLETPLTIEGHAEVTNYASATKNCSQFIARGIETTIHDG